MRKPNTEPEIQRFDGKQKIVVFFAAFCATHKRWLTPKCSFFLFAISLFSPICDGKRSKNDNRWFQSANIACKAPVHWLKYTTGVKNQQKPRTTLSRMWNKQEESKQRSAQHQNDCVKSNQLTSPVPVGWFGLILTFCDPDVKGAIPVPEKSSDSDFWFWLINIEMSNDASQCQDE